MESRRVFLSQVYFQKHLLFQKHTQHPVLDDRHLLLLAELSVEQKNCKQISN